MLFLKQPAIANQAQDTYQQSLKIFWIGMIALLVFRIIYLQMGNIGIYFDEAYYRFWSVTPDWGYYSKPPMVAWTIYVTNHLFGFMPEWTTKIGATLFYFFTSVVLFDLGRRLFDNKTAIYAGLIFFTMPLVSFNSLFITTDAPLIFFWALTLWLFVLAVQQNKLHWWILAGVAGGLGLLSKYTMGVLAIAILLFVLTSKNYRFLLTQSGVWIAVIIAAIIFTPNILWNAQHDFISLQHTSEISRLDKSSAINLAKFAEFFGGQFLVFGPIAFGLLLMLAVKRPQNAQGKLLIFAALSMLLVISLQAILSRAFVNWAAPAYVAGSLVVAYYLAQKSNSKLFAWLLGINLLLSAIFYFYTPLQKAFGVEPSEKNTPFQRIDGWKEVTLALKEKVPTASTETWVSDSRLTMSYLHFYLSDLQNQQSIEVRSFNPDQKIKDQFDLLWDLKDSKATSFYYVSHHKRNFAKCFAEVEDLGEVSYQVYPTLERRYYLYKLSGFKGYENCQ